MTEPGRGLALATAVAALWWAAPTAAAQPRTSVEGTLCPEPEARAFDFWIGSWDVVNRNRRPAGTRFHQTGRATDRVYPVVGGCGIVEHWRGRAIARFIVGFSVRAYDPAAGRWTLVLLWPTTGEPSFGELHGGFRHGRGTFSFRRVTAEGDTVLNRFTFGDVTPTSLRWQNGTSRDGGRTWSTGWIMEFTRRDPAADAGLLNGPSMTTRRYPGEEHRRFDPLLGEWEGLRATAAGDSVPVVASLTRILEGCAVMERVRAAEGGWEAFRVRAYEPAAGHWTEYALDSERRFLVRREAEEGDPLVFTDVAPGEGALTRTRWEVAEEGPSGWTVEAADDPAGPWRPRAVVRLLEPLGAPARPGGG